MMKMNSNWVRVLEHPRIHVDLDTGLVVNWGEVTNGKPEYMEVGKVSPELLARIKQHESKGEDNA